MSPVFWKFRPRSPNFKVDAKIPAAANKSECLFIRPVALTCAMSVNIDIRGEGVRPILTTSRMSVYLSDTGITVWNLELDETVRLCFPRVYKYNEAGDICGFAKTARWGFQPYYSARLSTTTTAIKIHQRGVQWKQGVVIYMML